MRRFLIRLMSLAAAVSVLIFGGCEGGSSHDFGDNDPNVVTVIADSMAEWGSPPWPTVLAQATGKTISNRALGGTTSDYGEGIVDGALAADKPGYLVIEFGANDIGHGRDRATTVESLRTMVRAAIANQTIPVVATLTPMYRGHDIFAGSARRLNELIRQMVSEEGAELADFEAAFGTDDSLVDADGLHPSQAGCELMASVVAGIVN